MFFSQGWHEAGLGWIMVTCQLKQHTATAVICPHNPKGPLLHSWTLLPVSHVSEPETSEKLLGFVHHIVFVLIKVYDAAI